MLPRLLTSFWLCRAISLVTLLAAVPARAATNQNPFDVSLFPQKFVAGTSSLVSWKPTADGSVSLKLFAGVSGERRYVSTIAHFIDNKGSFAWTPSIALDAGDDYALFIVSDADDQLIDCSPPFTIERPRVKRQEDQSSFLSFSPQITITTPEGNPTSEANTPTQAAASTSATVDTNTKASSSVSSPTVVSIANSATSIANPATSTTNPATSTQTATQISSSSSLPTGAAIGIGVGATLVVILLIALLVFFFLRRRRQKRQQPPLHDITSPGPAELETGKSGIQKVTELGHDGNWQAGQTSELGGGVAKPAMAELSSLPPLSQEEYAELERRRRAVELQGQSIGAVRAAELQGQAHPRAELEALRANSRAVHELGGHSILSEVQPVYQR